MKLKITILIIIFNFYFNNNIYGEENTSFGLSFENNRTYFPSRSSTWMNVNLSPEEKEKRFRYELTVRNPGGDILYRPEIPVTFLKKGSNSYIRYEINLSSEIKKLLYEYDPDFQILNYDDYSEKLISIFPSSPYNTPSVVIGDFNGDNREDILMVGKKIVNNKHMEKEIIILSTNTANNYIILKLSEGEYFPQKRDDIDQFYRYIRMGKKKVAYLFQPRGSKYICGGDYGKGFKTLTKDGYAMVEVVEDKLYLNLIYQWDDNRKQVDQYCVDMFGYYYIPVYLSLKANYYEYYQEEVNNSGNKQ
ncbi:MAG: hypothetical protein GX447_01135 [Elusimicrobia bacterium]|nr:hypothetical protein [Elusimicrobiota bacterium]